MVGFPTGQGVVMTSREILACVMSIELPQAGTLLSLNLWPDQAPLLRAEKRQCLRVPMRAETCCLSVNSFPSATPC